MRPEGIIESEVTDLSAFGVLCVVESSHVADHVYTEFAVQIGLSLVERPYSHSNFYTHYQISEYNTSKHIIRHNIDIDKRTKKINKINLADT